LFGFFLISASTKYCLLTDYARVNTLQKSSAAAGRYKKVIGAENHNAPAAEEATILSHLLLKITLRKLLPLCSLCGCMAVWR
jgi:hypothetical protein